MDRGKFVAVVTGAISLVLAIAYLLLVLLLDSRGLMEPAPQDLSQAAEFQPGAVAVLPSGRLTAPPL